MHGIPKNGLYGNGAKGTSAKLLKVCGVCLFLLPGLFACQTDSEEALLREKAIADSLRFNIPTIQITSPQNLDSVEVPFTLTYTTENWEISPNGKHVQFFINQENRGYHFGANSITLRQVDNGYQSIALELARQDFSLTGVLDSVRVYVKPRPAATFSLIVNNGSGSGNYPAGNQVTVAANVPDGMLFGQWEGDVAHLAAITDSVTQVSMPAEDIELTATFAFMPISFSGEILPILEAECLSCHNGLYSPNLASCGSMKAFAASVQQKITDANDPMPPDGLLPQAQIDLILQWISQGADCGD